MTKAQMNKHLKDLSERFHNWADDANNILGKYSGDSHSEMLDFAVDINDNRWPFGLKPWERRELGLICSSILMGEANR